MTASKFIKDFQKLIEENPSLADAEVLADDSVYGEASALMLIDKEFLEITIHGGIR